MGRRLTAVSKGGIEMRQINKYFILAGITILGLYRIGGVNSKVQKLMNSLFCKCGCEPSDFVSNFQRKHHEICCFINSI